MHYDLFRAIGIAAAAHNGRRDKGGMPYILHPMTVMYTVARQLPNDIDAQCAAVLHDVIEDTFHSPATLRAAGVSERAVCLVEALTKREGEDYGAYLDRVIAAGVEAKIIKLADVLHNLHPDRLDQIDEDKRARLEAKYQRALRRLAGIPE
jgi:(p)ppGpp synthase/HD superfamily hydrolase